MRKQTKLVAVLSTAALLAIGASMTSFAATGWAEEDGTWVYYNRDGERATEQWKKSGNNWYWLDSNGEMAIDRLIDDGDNYYYVDGNGVMASNQWVAIDNEDAGQDDEPDHCWYYFQANGKALKNGDNSKVALKTVNGKKYAFDEDGRMLFGWVSSDNAERIDDTDGDVFKEGDYYFGGGDDGAMRINKTSIEIDGDKYNFFFEKSGAHKGAGLTGEKDDKYYQPGKLLTAGKDEKYQVVKRSNKTSIRDAVSNYTYAKLDDVKDFLDDITRAKYTDTINDADITKLNALGVNKKKDDIKELYIIDATIKSDDYFIVNTSGKIIDSKSKNKDGNDYYYVIEKGGRIAAIYAEN